MLTMDYILRYLTFLNSLISGFSFLSEMYLLSLSWQVIRKAETLSVSVFTIFYFIYFNKNLYTPYLLLHYKSPQNLLE